MENAGKTGVAAESGAESGAPGAQSGPADPDLARLVAAWPTLPDAVRRCIVVLLNDTTGAKG